MSRPDLSVLEQLLAYGPWWLLFAAIIYGTARFTFAWCIPVAHFTVAAMVFCLDVRGILAQMNRPNWNGSLELAITEIVAHIFLVTTILLPLTALGVWQRRRKGSRAT